MVSSRIDISSLHTSTKSGLSEVVDMLGGMVAGGDELASQPGRSAKST